MSDAAAVLSALDRPAALIGPEGERLGANPAFNALPAALRARAVSPMPPPGWRTRDLPGGERLVLGAASAEDDRLLNRERFLATLSHEIRTPLNGVLGMAGLLAGTRLDATQINYLGALRDSAEHLLSLVNDVLDFAKLDSGKVELEPTHTDVERLLQGVCELLSPRAHEAGIEIAWAVEAGLPPVLADDGRLRQILFNLAGNAVKMTATGGVLVTAERRSRSGDGALRLRFCVRDTGPGLDPEAQARIFEEFVQTEAGARAGGAGLGLAIVKRLAEAFDGEVGLDSKAGMGATFWFEANFEAAGAAEGGREMSGLTVGVVSASRIVREAAARQVNACGGRAMTFETVAQAANAPVALLLVDPTDEKGRRLTHAPKGLPSLVLLAPEARGRIARYRAAGYAGYLIKPLRRASLAARVRAVLNQAPDAPVAARPAEDERAAPAGSCGARVLLAEDNAVNALLARALLDREGCSVDRVANGEEAIAAIAAAPYDIVLMDVRMPVMDGLSATRAIRAKGVKVPIVAMTADAFDDDRKACLDAGMDDFLSKPIDTGALRAALARWTAAREDAKLAS